MTSPDDGDPARLELVAQAPAEAPRSDSVASASATPKRKFAPTRALRRP